MDWNQAKGKWKQVSGKIKAEWGELTDNDLTEIDGEREQLVGKLQERYGIAKEEADKKVENFTQNCSC